VVALLGRWSCFAHVGPFLNGSATFAVEHDGARIDVRGLLKRVSRLSRVERRPGEVIVVRYRLRPFWGSTVVYLDAEAWAAIGSWARRNAVQRLREAGFVVTEYRAWVTKPKAVRELHPAADRFR